MIRVTHSKIYTVYVAFIILHFVTIEDVHCVSDSEEPEEFESFTGSSNNGLGRSLEGFVDEPLSDSEEPEEFETLTGSSNNVSDFHEFVKWSGFPQHGTQMFTNQIRTLINSEEPEEFESLTGSPKHVSDFKVSGKWSGSPQNGSFVKRLGRSLEGWIGRSLEAFWGRSNVKNVNETCLSNIKNDLENCNDARNCAEKMFNAEKDYSGLEFYSKIYVSYIYREMTMGHTEYLDSLNEHCKHTIRSNDNLKRLTDPMIKFKKCIQENKTFGFWQRYAYSSVVRAFFWSINVKNDIQPHEDFLYRLRAVKTTLLADTAVMNWKEKKGPTEFCSVKCIDQISTAFGGCTTFKECAIFAYKHVVKGDLKDYALKYMLYLYENIKVGEISINYDSEHPINLSNKNKSSEVPRTKQPILMSPKHYCLIISDELISNTNYNVEHWVDRVIACYDNMAESVIDLSIAQEKNRRIAFALSKHQYNENIINDKNIINDLNFIQKRYQYLSAQQTLTDDSNKGYFERVFFYISLDYIDRTSDAYDYVEHLMTFADFDENNVTESQPKEFCKREEMNNIKPISSLLPD